MTTIYPWLNIIAAITEHDQVIGLYNQLPWPRLSQDMKRFKELTTGNTVIMGNNTLKSLNYKPLVNRNNIVLSRNDFRSGNYNDLMNYSGTLIEGQAITILRTLQIEENIGWENRSIAWVIGGSQIYQQFLPYVNKLYLTIIHKKFYGDRHFPEIDKKIWEVESIEKIDNDVIPYSFQVWKRK